LEFTAGTLERARVRRIDEHLGLCATCSRIVLSALEELADHSPSPPEPDLIPLLFSPPALVANRFEVRRLLGRGGMGEVYEAYDRRHQCTVALKTVLASRCDSGRAMLRLARESKLSRRIEHPHVCRGRGTVVHEDAADGGRLRVIVMDFVDGETLGRRVRDSGPIPVAEVRCIARQILLALEAIHRARVLHLDVKSDNVMLRAGSPSPHAVLIDLGLARPMGSTSDTASAARALAGTLSYMAPEQRQSQPVGPQADLFSFGVVVFEMLTGRHPFPEPTGALPGTRPVGDRDLPLHPARLVTGLCHEIDDYVATCTRADPRLRYPDAGSALRHFDQHWR
jgi:serine/threonine protein kinase